MVRIKRGTASHKKKNRVLKLTKGFMWGRKSKYRLAKDALFHAWTHAYHDRKKKKGDFRRLWQIQIGAACKKQGVSYSKFINGLKKSKIEINRKMLSVLARNHSKIFDKVLEKAKEKI